MISVCIAKSKHAPITIQTCGTAQHHSSRPKAPELRTIIIHLWIMLDGIGHHPRTTPPTIHLRCWCYSTTIFTFDAVKVHLPLPGCQLLTDVQAPSEPGYSEPRGLLTCKVNTLRQEDNLGIVQMLLTGSHPPFR